MVIPLYSHLSTQSTRFLLTPPQVHLRQHWRWDTPTLPPSFFFLEPCLYLLYFDRGGGTQKGK